MVLTHHACQARNQLKIIQYWIISCLVQHLHAYILLHEVQTNKSTSCDLIYIKVVIKDVINWSVPERGDNLLGIHRSLCLVAAILSYMYMVIWGSRPSPFFQFKHTRDRQVTEMQKVTSLLGIDPKHYSGHCFRIGAATLLWPLGICKILSSKPSGR